MKFSKYKEDLKKLSLILGPWKKHEHCYGCECAYYSFNDPHSPFLNPNGYWYREDLFGNEIVYAFTEEQKITQDAFNINDGMILCDED